jgi:hypothetical protein
MSSPYDNHEHDWRSYDNNPSMLICVVEGCTMMTTIRDLVINTKRRAYERGAYDTVKRFLRNHWLTPRARKAASRQVAEHRFTRELEIVAPYQERLGV